MILYRHGKITEREFDLSKFNKITVTYTWDFWLIGQQTQYDFN